MTYENLLLLVRILFVINAVATAIYLFSSDTKKSWLGSEFKYDLKNKKLTALALVFCQALLLIVLAVLILKI